MMCHPAAGHHPDPLGRGRPAAAGQRRVVGRAHEPGGPLPALSHSARLLVVLRVLHFTLQFAKNWAPGRDDGAFIPSLLLWWFHSSVNSGQHHESCLALTAGKSRFELKHRRCTGRHALSPSYESGAPQHPREGYRIVVHLMTPSGRSAACSSCWGARGTCPGTCSLSPQLQTCRVSKG